MVRVWARARVWVGVGVTGLTLVDRIVANCESILSHFAKEKKLRFATFANLYRVYFFIKLFEITCFISNNSILRTNNSHFFYLN